MNWTLSDPTTRVVIPVGVAYGSNTEGARDLLLKSQGSLTGPTVSGSASIHSLLPDPVVIELHGQGKQDAQQVEQLVHQLQQQYGDHTHRGTQSHERADAKAAALAAKAEDAGTELLSDFAA